MELHLGDFHEVIVVKILEKGILVDMPDSTTEFIHVSQIAKTYVKYPESFVSVGHRYLAQCVKGVGDKQVQLSLKHLNLVDESIGTQEVPKKKHYERPMILDSQKDHKYCRQSNHNNRSISSRGHKSLDDMINDANASLLDKQRSMNSRNRKRRK